MSDWKADLPKRCCALCHFLEGEGEANSNWSEVSSTDRMFLVTSGIVPGDDRDIKCHRRVWDPANHPAGKAHHSIQAEISRDRTEKSQESCLLFYGYTPGMRFGTAIKSKILADAQREADADRKLTRESLRQSRLALWVAVGMLAAFIVVSIIGFFLADRECDRPHVPAGKVSAPEKPAPAPTSPAAKALQKK